MYDGFGLYIVTDSLSADIFPTPVLILSFLDRYAVTLPYGTSV